MYHEITDDPSSTGLQRPRARLWAHTTAAFDRHLEAVAAAAEPPRLVTELDPGGPGRHVVLTFDDGGKSAVHAAERLERRGWRGHFFIVTGLIGGRTFVKGSDVRRLCGAGHLVGSHSHSHPDILRDLSRPRLLEEWRVSARILEDLLGEPCLAASVPGGDLSRRVIETAAEAGYRFLFTSEPVLAPRRFEECWVLGRVQVKRSTSPEAVRRLVQFRGWGRARLERRVKEIARRGLAPLYRLYARRGARGVPGLTARGA